MRKEVGWRDGSHGSVFLNITETIIRYTYYLSIIYNIHIYIHNMYICIVYNYIVFMHEINVCMHHIFNISVHTKPLLSLAFVGNLQIISYLELSVYLLKVAWIDRQTARQTPPNHLITQFDGQNLTACQNILITRGTHPAHGFRRFQVWYFFNTN